MQRFAKRKRSKHKDVFVVFIFKCFQDDKKTKSYANIFFFIPKQKLTKDAKYLKMIHKRKEQNFLIFFKRIRPTKTKLR
jgi:hypothetical protein